MKKVDVIIPTYKPQKEFIHVLDCLQKQDYPIANIYIINTEQRFFDLFFAGMNLKEKYPNIEVIHIKKEEFDHASTRQMAMEKSSADYVVMMTMDACPADQHLISNLIRPLEEKEDVVAVSYARQLAKEDAYEVERFTRIFNYPPTSREKKLEDLNILGIKTYFCSDVCAAYNRNTFLNLGGYVKKAIFNEDMIYAAKAIKAGKSVYYAADAKVYHSHNYTGKQQFKRNFDNGVSQADHPEVFVDVPAEAEGVSMVKKTLFHLLKKGMLFQLVRLIYLSGCKYIGYRMGKAYHKLPKSVILKCTSDPGYWK